VSLTLTAWYRALLRKPGPQPEPHRAASLKTPPTRSTSLTSTAKVFTPAANCPVETVQRTPRRASPAVVLQACAVNLAGPPAPINLIVDQRPHSGAHSLRSAAGMPKPHVVFVSNLAKGLPKLPATQLSVPTPRERIAHRPTFGIRRDAWTWDALLQLQIIPGYDYITYSYNAVKFSRRLPLPSNRPAGHSLINLFRTPSDNPARRHANLAVFDLSMPHTDLDPTR